MNKQIAIEWLKKVYHDLGSAKILYEANHYTDTIGVDLHYAIEKSLKTFLAYDNKKIPKTHNLHELRELVKDYIDFDIDEIKLINIATDYHIIESYPVMSKTLPSRIEIKEILDFADSLFQKVCTILMINIKEIIQE